MGMTSYKSCFDFVLIIEIYFKMDFLKTTPLILVSLLIASSIAQSTLITTNAIQSLRSSPEKTDTINQQLGISSSPALSICRPNQIISTANLCIKPQYIQACQLYETVKTCSKCSSGYSINKDKKCAFIPNFTGSISHIKGCINQTSTVCNICAQGFYKKDDKCLLGVRNCLSYNKEGQCIQCEDHFSLILSQCRRNGLLGCKYQTESQTCSECYQPFTLNGQHCDINQCRILNDYGCVACECGYYLTIDRDCKPIAPGCLRYQKGICKNCLTHYKLKGGACQIEGCVKYTGNYCQKCSDKYDLVNGECKFKNCVDWLNDSCITCQFGYGLKDGICLATTAITCT